MGDTFTISAALTSTPTSVATLPQDVGDPYVYWIKAANAGTIGQIFQFRQNRHTRTVTDRTVIPANQGRSGGDVREPGETYSAGGDPLQNRLLTLNAGGTIDLAANPDSSIQGGSIHVTVGFNL